MSNIKSLQTSLNTTLILVFHDANRREMLSTFNKKFIRDTQPINDIFKDIDINKSKFKNLRSSINLISRI